MATTPSVAPELALNSANKIDAQAYERSCIIDEDFDDFTDAGLLAGVEAMGARLWAEEVNHAR